MGNTTVFSGKTVPFLTLWHDVIEGSPHPKLNGHQRSMPGGACGAKGLGTFSQTPVSGDLKKAFDRVDRDLLFNAMLKCGVPLHVVLMMIALYCDSEITLELPDGTKIVVRPTIGVKQGAVPSPVCFIFLMMAFTDTMPWPEDVPAITFKWARRTKRNDFTVVILLAPRSESGSPIRRSLTSARGSLTSTGTE